jgi:hypothetical protein
MADTSFQCKGKIQKTRIEQWIIDIRVSVLSKLCEYSSGIKCVFIPEKCPYSARSGPAHPAAALLFLAPASSTADIAAIPFISWNVTAEYRYPSTSSIVRSAFASSIP